MVESTSCNQMPPKTYPNFSAPKFPQRIFDVTQPLHFANKEDFDLAWSISDKAWVKDGGEYHVNGGEVTCQRYRCALLRKTVRIRKSHEY